MITVTIVQCTCSIRSQPQLYNVHVAQPQLYNVEYDHSHDCTMYM